MLVKTYFLQNDKGIGKGTAEVSVPATNIVPKRQFHPSVFAYEIADVIYFYGKPVTDYLMYRDGSCPTKENCYLLNKVQPLKGSSIEIIVRNEFDDYFSISASDIIIKPIEK